MALRFIIALSALVLVAGCDDQQSQAPVIYPAPVRAVTLAEIPKVVAKINPVESRMQYNWWGGKHSSTFIPVSETHYYLVYADGHKDEVTAEVWAVTPIYVAPPAPVATAKVEK